MSFGFSISDFTTAAGLAWTLYQECDNAEEEYRNLSDRLRFLHNVLNDVESTVKKKMGDKVPNDRFRVESLIAAKDMSNAVLREVKHFVEKHDGMASESNSVWAKIVHTLKFIGSDVEKLNKKMDLSSSQLQLSLDALVNVSVQKLDEKLENIWKDISEKLDMILNGQKAGVKDRSVVSHTLLGSVASSEGGLPSKNDVLQQFVRSLEEEKDVHPDCVVLNRDYIDNWISSHMLETPVASVDHVLADHDSPQTDRNVLTNYEDTPMPLIPKDANSGLSSLSNSDASLALPPTTQDKPTKGSAAIPDKVCLPPPRPLSPSSDISISSHRSKPEDWHPYSGSKPEYVSGMLLGLFQDPRITPRPETSRLRITRAFNQLDWTHRRYLTRNETVEVCTDVLRRCGITEEDPSITALVRGSDVNQDGRITKDEFIVILNDLIRNSDFKSRNAQRKLNRHMNELDASLVSYTELIETYGITPWCCEAQIQAGRTVFLDLIDRSTATDASAYSKMPDAEFTRLTIQADECVRAINHFEKTWLRIVPKSLISQFTHVIERLLDAALLYVKFEKWNQQDGRETRQLSDFDVILICDRTLARVQRTPTHLPNFLLELQDLKETATSCSRALRGICSCLEAFEAAGIEPVSYNFPKFQQKWRDEHIEAMVHEMNSQHTELLRSKITTTLKSGSSDGSQVRNRMESDAIATLRAYNAFMREMVKFGERRAFKVKFSSVDWRWDRAPREAVKRPRSCLLLDSEVACYFRATAGIDGHYEPQQETDFLEVYPTTKLQFELIGGKKNGMALLCQSKQIEAQHITDLCDPARKARHVRFTLPSSVTVDDRDCELTVTAEICNETEVTEKIERWKSTKWTDFLHVEHQIDPEFWTHIHSLPAGVDVLFDNSARGVYFFDRSNRTSTWTKPLEWRSSSYND